MKFQLTRTEMITPIINGRLDYNSQEMSKIEVIKEWNLFIGMDILRTIRANCPDSNVELADLVEWHIDISAHADRVYTHLLVGSIHKDVRSGTARFQKDIAFQLDYVM